MSNYNGYDVRAPKEAEVELTKALAPEKAEEQGVALGMVATGKWEVAGIPRNSARAVIHQTVAREAGTWTGWITRPLRTTAPPRNGKVTWSVKVACEPSLKSLIVNGKDMVHIYKYNWRTKMSKNPAQ